MGAMVPLKRRLQGLFQFLHSLGVGWRWKVKTIKDIGSYICGFSRFFPCPSERVSLKGKGPFSGQVKVWGNGLSEAQSQMRGDSALPSFAALHWFPLSGKLQNKCKACDCQLPILSLPPLRVLQTPHVALGKSVVQHSLCSLYSSVCSHSANNNAAQ